MRILYITTFYEQRSASAAIRNSAWVNGLIEDGCEVTVLTVDWPDNLKSRFLMENNRARVYRTYLPELDVLKVTTSKIKKSSFAKLTPIRHFIRDLIFFPDICRRWNDKVDLPTKMNYDILISSSDFKSSHYVAKQVKEANKELPWIQIWGDPWKDDVGLNWLNKIRAAKKEKELLTIADKVIYVSAITKERMSRIYPLLCHKFHYLPRGFYKSVYNVSTENKGDIHITYTGGMSIRYRNSLALLECIEMKNRTKNRRLHVDFYGLFDAETKEQFGALDCCTIHSAVDYEEILKVYQHSDALLFVANKGNSSQIPGKLFDYMGTNLPIICLVDSLDTEIANWLRSFPRCLLIENSNKGVQNSIDMIYSFINNKYDIVQEFSPNSIAKQLLSILK